MAKHASKTKVFIDGRDVSSQVFRAVIPREVNGVDQVELTLAVDQFTVYPDGTLAIHITTEE